MNEQDSISLLQGTLLLQQETKETDVKLPQYYREGFFSQDAMLHPELTGNQFGVAGDPVPYSILHDDIITGLLLFCFVTYVIAFSKTKTFLTRQFKNFFYQSRGTTEINETANEIRFQIYLVALTAIMLALLFYFYTLRYIGTTFVLQSPYQLILIFLGIILVWLLTKIVLYSLVNDIFFNTKNNVQWIKTLLFIYTLEGALLYPAVITWAYMGMLEKNVIIYAVFVFILVKILTFYKTYSIFFVRNVVRLQIILYFCALEIVPLVALWSSLVLMANNLKINY